MIDVFTPLMNEHVTVLAERRLVVTCTALHVLVLIALQFIQDTFANEHVNNDTLHFKNDTLYATPYDTFSTLVERKLVVNETVHTFIQHVFRNVPTLAFRVLDDKVLVDKDTIVP